ncbi:hypothetical protein EVAR_53280_1 [Eumeta japonica]|uniref:Uncharacterized protein n=1 Tax=Eumeta variegata TaxID=151549 RepID=A0A4C1Z0Q3_EUMVA|nr:hypothetical protein EVAR_53280_1 [Eumeta japonica]
MALLANKTHLSEFKLGEKDAQSEASESGTSNSVTSAEDLQKLAIILGLSNPEDVYQERFRVDRRRLENMLADPHVRVAGRPEDVRLARESIMQVLDTRMALISSGKFDGLQRLKGISGAIEYSICATLQCICLLHFMWSLQSACGFAYSTWLLRF